VAHHYLTYEFHSSPLSTLGKSATHLHALVRLQDLLFIFSSVHELTIRLSNEGNGWHGRRNAGLLGYFLVRGYRQGAERVWQSTNREHLATVGLDGVDVSKDVIHLTFETNQNITHKRHTEIGYFQWCY
jgi:hypothetical protein